jgi:hypothetical protein
MDYIVRLEVKLLFRVYSTTRAYSGSLYSNQRWVADYPGGRLKPAGFGFQEVRDFQIMHFLLELVFFVLN